MSVLKSLTSADVLVFKANAEAYEGFLLELRERSAEARRGGGEQAANVLRTVQEDNLRREGKEMTEEEREEFMRPILEKYEREGNPYHSTARLWDDGVIDPVDTRMVLALGLSAAANAPLEETHYGIFRMMADCRQADCSSSLTVGKRARTSMDYTEPMEALGIMTQLTAELRVGEEGRIAVGPCRT